MIFQPKGSLYIFVASMMLFAINSRADFPYSRLKAGAILAVDEDTLDQAVDLMKQGDAEALDELIQLEQIIITKIPINVIKAGSARFWTHWKVRLKGHSGTLWTRADMFEHDEE